MLKFRKVVVLSMLIALAISLSGCFPLGLVNLDRIRDNWRAPNEATLPTLAPLATLTPTQPAVPGSVIVQVSDEGDLLADLYDRVNPSVVNIAVVRQVSVTQAWPLGEATTQYQSSEGSGFVYDKLGHIITNNHVVEGAEEIRVTFADDAIFSAELVGRHPDSDLAVIRIDADPVYLHPLPLGDSDQVRVGQRVVAIGNPFGLAGTMTTGIISAKGRLLPASGEDSREYNIPSMLQTDASINPGNSGGPLLDLSGFVVGVNSAISSPVQASVGVGFAVPANIIRRVVPALIETGNYQDPWLGVSLFTLDPLVNRALGLDEAQRGVLVVTVVAGSPAEKAGIRASDELVEIEGSQFPVGGDVIVAINGEPIVKYDDLIEYLVLHTTVGQQVELSILRDGSPRELRVELAPRPVTDPAQ